MLVAIQIRDLAVVQALELELHSGLTVLTGETGAGKSILVDALGLALGDRGSAGLVRHGAERAEITVLFDLNGHEDARQWLQEAELDMGEECHLRRTIGQDGRSRGYINGRPAPMQSLRELGEMLVEIHGQHEHQSLIKRDHQRALLDACGGLLEQLRKTSTAYGAWREARDRLQALSGDAASRVERMDLLRYQIQELEALALAEGEFAQLEEEQTRLGHAETLLSTARGVIERADGDNDHAVSNALAQITRDLESLQRIDPTLAESAQLFETAGIQLREGVDALHRYLSGVELDPQRLRSVEERMGTSLDLARKHRVRADELPALLETLKTELADLEAAGENLEGLRERVDTLAAGYLEIARRLSRARGKAAGTLSSQVTDLMHQLGMPQGAFEVRLDTSEEEFHPQGLDRVEFLVTANPGHPPQALSKVASGGELSRISLAIQVAAIDAEDTQALIFDEVDAGIGGGTAEVVGQKLRSLGRTRQVMCVTHLAQVAAQGHHQVTVEKQVRDGTTSTAVRPVHGESRVAEIARMLGGVRITDKTLGHAREMVEGAQRNEQRRAG